MTTTAMRPRKAATQTSPASAARRTTWVVRLSQVGLVVLWLAAWDLTVRSGVLAPVLAKSPMDSWRYIMEATVSGELFTNLGATMIAVIIAWVLAGVLGVCAGIAVGLLPTVERVISPFMDAVNAMPRIALAPLFIVVFGITTTAKVAVAATLVFFIVFSGSRAGVRSTDAELLRLSTVLGAKPHQIFAKVLFPVAVPAIFASLRLGLVYSLLGVVGSELISARDGLGQLVAMYSATFRMEAVYAILIVLAIIATILNLIMATVERRLLRWQPPTDR
ncbi:MAG: ABC transporter permease [Microbacterium sp.]